MINTLAIVPLRGGSKSIPDKNIKLIAGKPLCTWVLEALKNSGCADKIIVSTDSEKISQIVKNLNLGVDIIKRPDELATDHASTEDVVKHVLKTLPAKTVILAQATSPQTQAEDFKKALTLFKQKKYDSLVTAVRIKRFFWNDAGKPLNYTPNKRPMRQNFNGSLMENGAFYISTASLYLKKPSSRLGGKIGVYEMDENNAVELDEPQDWLAVENFLLRYRSDFEKIIKKIKYLILDVDGTLTDAGMYYSSEGDALKKFNTKDGVGIRLIKEKLGIKTILMTSENSPIVSKRADKLGIQDVYLGIHDKAKKLLEINTQKDISLEQIAYMGDDLNDLEALKIVGLRACPNNAVNEIKVLAHFISKKNGGDGAVRDLCDFMLRGIDK